MDKSISDLPTDPQARKEIPIFSGVIAYFPLALAEIAKLSKFGNDKHNPGEPLHWSRDKSTDHLDTLARHLTEAGKVDTSTGDLKLLHDVALAWRALANLQVKMEERLQRAAELEPIPAIPPAPSIFTVIPTVALPDYDQIRQSIGHVPAPPGIGVSWADNFNVPATENI